MEPLRTQFTEELDALRRDAVRMAALTGEAIGAATRALLDRDLELADRVVAEDRAIDELKLDIETRAYQVLVRQQPAAGDLRTILAVMRILHELELSADLMVAVAKGARRLYPHELPPRQRGVLERMGAQATVQHQAAVEAFADLDISLAAAVSDMDDVMDDLQKELFRAIFATASADERGIEQAVQVALIGRFYERVADHAVLVAHWVNFMVTGEMPVPPTLEVPPDGGDEGGSD